MLKASMGLAEQTGSQWNEMRKNALESNKFKNLIRGNEKDGGEEVEEANGEPQKLAMAQALYSASVDYQKQLCGGYVDYTQDFVLIVSYIRFDSLLDRRIEYLEQLALVTSLMLQCVRYSQTFP